jgi:K+-transporting ATPase ATPase C chain
MKTLLRPAVTLFLLFSGLTGIVYPLLVTGIGKLMFPQQVAGSLLKEGDKWVGSSLIGQPFTEPKYFWGRLSATAPYPYNASASSGSNLGPLNPTLREVITARIKALREADPGNSRPIPIDLVTASASGLDPHISPAAAEYQVSRIARLRKLAPATVQNLVQQFIETPQWGVFGESRVNVLRLNLALDKMRGN